jgi:TonB family protein
VISKAEHPAKTVPKTQPKQGRGPQQGEKTTAKVTAKAPPSQNAAVAAKTESTANIRKATVRKTENAQRETGPPETQAQSKPVTGIGSGSSDIEKNAAGESINGTVHAAEGTDDPLELQAGMAPTWDSIAALAPGDVAANLGNSASEIKPVPMKTETPVVVKNTYTPPVLVSKVNPSYPRIAAQIRKTGVVTLKLDINKQGRVTNVEPVKGPEIFYEEATRAALQWRYRPAARDGRSEESQVTVSINFNIE